MENRNRLSFLTLCLLRHALIVAPLLVLTVVSMAGCQLAGRGRMLQPPPMCHGVQRPVQLSLPQISTQRIATLDLLDQQQLPTLVGGQGAVLLDFYADWCGPCQKQGEVLKEMELKDFPDARIVKVNVDRHADLAQEFQVNGLPTLVLFRDGEIVKRKTGFADAAELTRLLQN